MQGRQRKHLQSRCRPDCRRESDSRQPGSKRAADPIMGTVMNSSGAGISGVTVNLLNSSKNVVSSATTDAMGFFYFPATGGLAAGTTYTNKVAIVKPYKNTTPAS